MSRSSPFERLVPPLLALGVLLTFGWTLNAPTFVTDGGSVLGSPLLSWWKNVPFIFSRHFLMFSDGQFRPLSYALVAVVRTFVPVDNVWFWRLWLWTFHWLNAVLVFLLVRRFSKRPASAFVAALLFTWHPLASVVANQFNHFHYVLGLTFYLGALYGYLRYADTNRKGYYVGAVVLFALGLLTSKILVTLPIVICAYELLYQRSKLRVALVRLLAFGALLLCCLPFWWLYRPHPLYYKYPQFPPGTGRNSFLTVVSSTGLYLKGLLLGLSIPVVMEEVVGKVMRLWHWRPLLWAGIDMLALVAAGWALLRKRWAGLGVILVIIPMLPFMSTAWSGVHDYVSWAYLYAALAGLAVVVGGVLDWLWPPSWSLRNARAVAWTVLCLVIVYYASQQVRINVASGSAEKYWLRVLRLNPRSESASLNLGRFYLQRGEVTKALGFLFSPPIEDVGPSCLAVSHYYSGRGDYLAAAIHLRTTAERKDGILFQQPQMSSAALFTAAGAPDYAEGALGSALMADPFNTKAMGDLAEIWLLKGYVNAAEGCVDRMLRLSPRDERARVLKGALEAYVRSAVTSDTSAVINPPPPRWLRYLVQGVQEGLTGPAIVRAGEEHPDDPIVQVTAATYLMQHGELQLAKTKLDKAAQSLVSSASLWARKCWVDTRMGAYAEAEAAGKRALELNPTSSAVHNALGVLWSTAPGQRRDLARAEQHYRRTLDLSPVQASVHVGLGNVLVQRGKVDEGIQHYRQALGINENLVEAQENLGLALLGQGKLDEAMVHLERALQIDPESATAHYSMGFALLRQGKIDQAAEHSRKAFQVKPDYVEAYTQLGRALARKGDLGQAARYLQEALRISPNDATAHNNLGVVLAEQHNLDEAVTHYSAALRASPGFREAYNNLGMALIAQGRYGDAIQAVQGWLEVVPQDVNEAVRMAWLLATCPDDAYRNGMEAARLAQEICDVTKYKHTNALDALAAAHAEMGRFDTAVQFATRAREMALSKGREQLAKDIGVRIQMYNDRRPYRLAP